MPNLKIGDIVIERGEGPAYPRQRRIIEVLDPGYYVVHHPAEPSSERFIAHESNLITPAIKEERMPETVKLLETALANELTLLKKLINELEGEDLHEFVRRLTELRITRWQGERAVDEILHLAQNIKGIEDSLNNFYVI